MEDDNHIHQKVSHIVENKEDRMQISLSLIVCIQNIQLIKLNSYQNAQQLHAYMVNQAKN